MLMAHPAVLEELLERYQLLQQREQTTPAVLRALEDTMYTLCVATGTRDITDAVAAARRRLAEAAVETAVVPAAPMASPSPHPSRPPPSPARPPRPSRPLPPSPGVSRRPDE